MVNPGVLPGEELGFHGLRVEGYNLSKLGNGEDITVAHGLWKSNAHTRYQRFKMSQIIDIPRRSRVHRMPSRPPNTRGRWPSPARARTARRTAKFPACCVRELRLQQLAMVRGCAGYPS